MYRDGWDPVPAYLYKIIELNKTLPRDKIITQQTLQQWGALTPLYPGVVDIFSHLQELASLSSANVQLEFYVISSGLETVVRSSAIAHHFADIWGCDFHCADDGAISFPKRIVSFTDKTRYLFQISKGIVGEGSHTKPFEVNKKFKADDKRIPMDQMIFIGDGYTDIPCFSLVSKMGGIPIAVCDKEDHQKWQKAWGFLEENRVKHWAVGDYTKGSTLWVSLSSSVEKIIHKISQRRI